MQALTHIHKLEINKSFSKNGFKYHTPANGEQDQHKSMWAEEISQRWLNQLTWKVLLSPSLNAMDLASVVTFLSFILSQASLCDSILTCFDTWEIVQSLEGLQMVNEDPFSYIKSKQYIYIFIGASLGVAFKFILHIATYIDMKSPK